MKVRIIRNTIANKEQVFVGQILELSESEARLLIAAGKAVAENSVEISQNPEVETADFQPVMETADVKSPRKKKG